MRVISCGGRKYSDKATLKRVLDEIHAETPITFLIEGGALGWDRLSSYWAASTGIRSVRVSADWSRFGPGAGPIRNQKMIDEHKPIDLVIAGPGGSGTEDMVLCAEKAGIPVRRVG